MLSLFRRDPEQGWHYREAWYDESAGEFVVHHGKVGTNGKITAEKASAEEAESLVESFAAQCADDGYAEPADDDLGTLTVAYPLKGAEPSASERRNANTVHEAVLVALAWRGLGALSDPEQRPREARGQALVMTSQTVHTRKALDAAQSAIKHTDVPLSKVEITR